MDNTQASVVTDTDCASEVVLIQTKVDDLIDDGNYMEALHELHPTLHKHINSQVLKLKRQLEIQELKQEPK